MWSLHESCVFRVLVSGFRKHFKQVLCFGVLAS